jgi:Ca-activated chloride channel family protein
MKITIWAGAMLAIMLSAVLSDAGDTGRIAGHVFDSSTQAPVAGATISVEGTQLQARTAADGSYVIDRVPAGIYVVRLQMTGVPSLLQRVAVTAGQTATLDFGLTHVQDLPTETERAAEKDEVKNLGKRSEDRAVPESVRSSATNQGTARHRMVYESPTIVWQSPGTESYDIIRENGWLTTANRPLSTFSVDVDAASYANVRRFITSGQLPPVDAVRIEELINYFDYDYPNPRGQHPFSITTEVAECPWNSENKLVHIGLQGERIAVEDLPPSNLVFLIDVSGSMNHAPVADYPSPAAGTGAGGPDPRGQRYITQLAGYFSS